MSEIIYVIYWKSDRYTGEVLERGNDAERRVINRVAGGDLPGEVEKIERYEGECDATEDVAIALAKRFATGETVRPEVYEFIETHAGPKYLAGLRRSEMTFAAE